MWERERELTDDTIQKPLYMREEEEEMTERDRQTETADGVQCQTLYKYEKKEREGEPTVQSKPSL